VPDVAAVIVVQLVPEVEHRSHWYAYVVGISVQDPVDAANREPKVGVPVIVGAVRFCGTPTMTLVASELTVVDPEAFVAVTLTRRVSSRSVVATTWVVDVAPLIAVQLAPEALQSSHW
jgi:hypothetical protein